MKRIVSILALISFVSTLAQAGLPPSTIQGQSDATPKTKFSFQVPFSQFTDLGGIKALIETGNKNLLANASFENSVFSTGWTLTKTSGTSMTSAVETSTVVDGKQSAKISLTAAYGTWDQSVTPAVNIAGQNYQAYCRLNISSGVGNVQVCALEAGLEQNCATAPVTSSFQYVLTNFVAKTNGDSLGVRVKSTVADTTSWYVDDCDVEPAKNLGMGTFTTPWKNDLTWSYDNLGTVTNNNVWYRRVGDSMEVKGSVNVGTTVNAALAIDLPAGYTIDSTKFSNNSNAQSVGYVNRANTSGSFASTSSGPYVLFYDGSTTNKIFMANTTVSGSFNKDTGTIFLSGNLADFHFTIPITQFTDQSFFRADTTPASWSGYSSGVSGGCSTTSGTYADPSSCTGIGVTQLSTRNMTCSQSGTGPAISCNFPRSGNYWACAMSPIQTSSTNNSSLRLVDGSGTVINPGLAYVPTGSGGGPVLPLCGVYNVSAAGTQSLKIQAAANGGTVSLAYAAQSTPAGTAQITWSIVELDAPMAAPFIMPSADVQTFTSSGTWTKPSGNYNNVRLILIGGGGGGGGGAREATGVASGGGGGGSSGAIVDTILPMSYFAASETITIGASAAGGAGASADSTAGSSGGGGNDTVFSATVTKKITAAGGNPGNAGSTTAGSGGAITNVVGTYASSNGGTSSVTGAASSSIVAPFLRGGGGGGGVNTANTGQSGAAVSRPALITSNTAVATTTGGTGDTSTAGTSGGTFWPVSNTVAIPYCVGGGGGAGSAVGAAGNGGDGGNYGCGGGGGGGARNGNTAGSGGVGAQGLAIIISMP